MFFRVWDLVGNRLCGFYCKNVIISISSVVCVRFLLVRFLVNVVRLLSNMVVMFVLSMLFMLLIIMMRKVLIMYVVLMVGLIGVSSVRFMFVIFVMFVLREKMSRLSVWVLMFSVVVILWFWLIVCIIMLKWVCESSYYIVLIISRESVMMNRWLFGMVMVFSVMLFDS